MYAESMNGIPKGLCSFGGVQRQRRWSLFTAFTEQRKNTEALRKGELKNSPVDCLFKRDAPAREGVP